MNSQMKVRVLLPILHSPRSRSVAGAPRSSAAGGNAARSLRPTSVRPSKLGSNSCRGRWAVLRFQTSTCGVQFSDAVPFACPCGQVWLRQRTFNPMIVGSNPTGGTSCSSARRSLRSLTEFYPSGLEHRPSAIPLTCEALKRPVLCSLRPARAFSKGAKRKEKRREERKPATADERRGYGVTGNVLGSYPSVLGSIPSVPTENSTVSLRVVVEAPLAVVAQLVGAAPCRGEGCGFESHRWRAKTLRDTQYGCCNWLITSHECEFDSRSRYCCSLRKDRRVWN